MRKVNPMKRLFALCMALTLSACIVPEPAVRPMMFDLGQPPVPAGNAPARQVLVVGEVQSVRRLDANYIFYRLDYANPQEPKPYANSRWAMPPSQLLGQRIKSRLSQDFAVVSPGDAVNAPILKIELESFDHEFLDRKDSQGVMQFRASLLRNRQLLAQRTFRAERPALSADAQGGVRALTLATDDLLEDLASWVLAATAGKS